MEKQIGYLHLGGRRVQFTFAIIVVLLLWICPANGTLLITDMTLTIEEGVMYHGPEDGTSPGEFQLQYENGLGPPIEQVPILSGDLKVNNTPQVSYQLQNAWVSMTPSYLASDNSGGTGVADGDFYAGAVLTLWGTIVEKATSNVVFPDGLIMTAEITHDFNLAENDGFPFPQENKIEGLDIQLDITGGELASNGVSDLVIYDGDDMFDLTYNLLNCQQLDNSGGAVEDFQSMIDFGTLSTLVYSANVPEPVTAVLVGLGSILMLRRRRYNV
jgi:hypothetical protein